MAADATATWVMDTTPPIVNGIAPVSPNPTNLPVDSIDVTFFEPINISTFTSADLALTRDGIPVPLSGVTVTLISGSAYRVAGLAGATTDRWLLPAHRGRGRDRRPCGEQRHRIRVRPMAKWTPTPPTVLSISPVSPDPRNAAIDSVDVTFSEPIDPASFETSDLGLTLDGMPIDLSGLTVEALSPFYVSRHWFGSVHRGRRGLCAGGGCRGRYDLAGNVGTGTAAVGWTMDTTSPTVTIDQGERPGRPDHGSIQFAVVFSEPVIGFAPLKWTCPPLHRRAVRSPPR